MEYELCSWESFDIIPCILETIQEDVADEKIQHFTPSIQFIAKRMKTVIPHLPIRTEQEWQLFFDTAPQYVNSKGILNSQKMSYDWNQGCLKLFNGVCSSTPNGSTSFQKLPSHLALFFETYKKIMHRHMDQRDCKIHIKKLYELLLNTDGISFLDENSVRSFNVDNENIDSRDEDDVGELGLTYQGDAHTL
jgi:hypothetical protein